LVGDRELGPIKVQGLEQGSVQVDIL
jgi:hypothetical protein